PFGRENLELAERKARARQQHQVYAACEREIALTGAQALAGLVNGHERRRAGRVHRHRRPTQIERVGQPVGQDAVRGPRTRMAVYATALRKLQQVVVDAVAVRADVDPGGRAGQPIDHLTRGFESLPGEFQQQALLRVHLRRFARRDAEEGRVESVHTVEETAASRVNAVGSSRIGVEERLAVPALGRYI